MDNDRGKSPADSTARRSARWLIGAVATCALAGYFSAANAVVFFKDDFERSSLDDRVGKANSLKQNQMPSGRWDYFDHTPVWTGGANGIELQTNGTNGFNAYSGKYRVELDTNTNSSMSTLVNLVRGQLYHLRFRYRSYTRPGGFFGLFPITVGGGLKARIDGPGFTSGDFLVGDFSLGWLEANFYFVYNGTTSGEARLSFAATGTADSYGTSLDLVELETNDTELGSVEELKGILPPSVPGLLSSDSTRSDIVMPVVVDKSAAIALGKALFWDQAIGSDQMACASCHFHAGTDNRIKNQISPGLLHIGVASGLTFDNLRSGSKSGPNYTVKKGDFPFDPNVDDTLTSAGTFSGNYRGSPSDTNNDLCERGVNPVFHVNGIATRNVAPRNTPTVINAAYNYRNFWDGRANNEFNGASPSGRRDVGAGVYMTSGTSLVRKPLRLRNSSLASQAVGPVGSDFEMACRVRQFADVGRKMLSRKPLALQTIAADDSVLSSLPTLLTGTTGTYADLVKKAFAPAYWNGACNGGCGVPAAGVTPSTAYSQMEANFSMYFGLAVQLYEETLVSDDSRYDKWKRSLVFPSFSEMNGENLFKGKGHCIECHSGPTGTTAAHLQKNDNLVEGMLLRDARKVIYDVGFYNLGVVPTEHDNGGGATDPWGNPLSFARQYITSTFVDKFSVEPCQFELDVGLCSNDSVANRAAQNSAVTGTFKTPTLRNVELTGPYLHNGGLLTLAQVVDFYDRGGNVANVDKHPGIAPIGFSASEKTDLVNFLKTLTDDRVKYERAPFDHPSLKVPNGHVGNSLSVTAGNSLDPALPLAQDEYKVIPAVGRNGSATALPTFDTVVPN